MYNLFRFFVRYYLFFLFILLEVFSFYLIYRNNHYQEAAYVNMANGLNGKAYASYTGVMDYFYLRRFSDSLVTENASLRAQLADSKYISRIDSGRITDSTGKHIQSFTYLTARVIKNSVDQPANFIYLDKGSLQGIRKHMGVINSRGIVGRVINVTEHYSAVMSELNKDFKEGGKFKKNDYIGNLHWDGVNSTTATMENVPKHVPVKVGDTIVTDGYSGLFPRNIMIGVVKKVTAIPENTFLEISVNLSTDFNNLNYVYIVDNLKLNELQTLNNSTDSLTKKK